MEATSFGVDLERLVEVHQVMKSGMSIPDSEGIWHFKTGGGKNRGR